MSKTKRIRVLKKLIELEKCKKEPDQEYIDWAEEEITKLFLILTSRQRKIRSNRERRQALKTA